MWQTSEVVHSWDVCSQNRWKDIVLESVSETSSPSCSSCASQCWETRVGQEMYKLTVFDLLITIATLVLVEFPRRYTHCPFPPNKTSVGWCAGEGAQDCFPVCVCVSGWWWTTHPMGCCRRWDDRSLSFPPTFWCWSTARLWFGPELSFAPCFRSSTPSNLSSSSTARRWLDHRGDRISHSALCFVSCGFHVSTAVVSPQITLFYNCRPALRTFRSTTSTFFFLVVLLFGWGLATAVMAYSVAAWAFFLLLLKQVVLSSLLRCSKTSVFPTQDPPIGELWTFPFLPQHVAGCSDYSPQPLWHRQRISVLHRFPSILHPFIHPIMVTCFLYKYTNVFFIIVLLYNHCFSSCLPVSVWCCVIS